MMLLEHHAKQLLAEGGLPVPPGVLVRPDEAFEGQPPVVAKAQVAVGGRGKAGGIRVVRSGQDLAAALAALFDLTIKGHEVRACRIEEMVAFESEAYVSFTVEPSSGRIRVLMSPHGGVEVEDEATRAGLLSESAAPDAASVAAVAGRLAQSIPQTLRGAMRAACDALVPAFFAFEAVMLEINPLFVRADGSWAIGDTKLAIDENAFPRQPALQAIVEENPDLYPEAALKLKQGFDYVGLDPDGDIGLVTTGAGLSMQLVDELVARGRRPYDFCDIRTGQFQGDPARLILVLESIAAGPSIRSVLINFFAGHTDLGEIARLLLLALAAVPQLKAPITARFIGNNLAQAQEIIAAAGNPIGIETDLERAIDLAIERADAAEIADA